MSRSSTISGAILNSGRAPVLPKKKGGGRCVCGGSQSIEGAIFGQGAQREGGSGNERRGTALSQSPKGSRRLKGGGKGGGQP